MNTIFDREDVIINAFNNLVPGKLSQDMFKMRLALWKNAKTLYSTYEEFIAIISAHAKQINALDEFYQSQSASGEVATYRSISTHKKGTTTTTKHTGADTTTTGEQTQHDASYVYPTGYTGNSDKAYLATENDSTQPPTTVTNGHDTQDEQVNAGQDDDTVNTFDLSTFAEKMPTMYVWYFDAINACIYDIIYPFDGGTQWH